MEIATDLCVYEHTFQNDKKNFQELSDVFLDNWNLFTSLQEGGIENKFEI